EYFAYDPHPMPLAPQTTQRLFGWRLDPRAGIMRPLSLRFHGYLRSLELDSYLLADGRWLRLYDPSWHLRLTEAEAAAQRAEAAAVGRRTAERQARVLAEKLRSLGIDPDQLS